MDKRKRNERWGVLFITLTAGITVILNNSLFNVALPYFMVYYDLPVIHAQWIVTAFILGLLLTMPVTAFLGRKLGYKKVYIYGLTIFFSASIFGSIAWDVQWVILARLLQGLGGGLIMPLSMMLIFQFFEKHERGFAMGIWGISAMAAPAIGPTIGGLVLNFSDWHMLFLINVPMSMICLSAALYFLKKPSAEVEEQPFDRKGYLLIVTGLILLILGVGQITNPAMQYWSIVMMLFSILFIFLFVKHSFKITHPLLNLRIYKNKAFTFGIVIILCGILGMAAVILLLPLLIQTVLGNSPLITGLIFIPYAMTMGIFMVLGGKILDRKGPSIPLMSGIIMIASMAFVLSQTLELLPLWLLIIFLMMYAMGNGSINTPAATAALNSLKEDNVRSGSSLIALSKQCCKVMVLVGLSLMYEVRRSAYLSLEYTASEAGMLAIKDCFFIVGLLAICVLPFAWYMCKTYQVKVTN